MFIQQKLLKIRKKFCSLKGAVVKICVGGLEPNPVNMLGVPKVGDHILRVDRRYNSETKSLMTFSHLTYR